MTASVAGLWLSSLKTDDAHARETGFLGAEAFANTAAVVGLTQLIAGRERPTEGNGNGRFWQNNTLGSSFPSAHSSFTWTLASVVAHEYPKVEVPLGFSFVNVHSDITHHELYRFRWRARVQHFTGHRHRGPVTKL